MICWTNNTMIVFNFDFLSKRSQGQHQVLQGGDLGQSVTDSSLSNYSSPSCHSISQDEESSEDSEHFCDICCCNPCDCHR